MKKYIVILLMLAPTLHAGLTHFPHGICAGTIVDEATADNTQGDKDLFIKGTAEFDGAVRFDGAIDANSTLNVAGTSTFTGDVTFEGDIITDAGTLSPEITLVASVSISSTEVQALHTSTHTVIASPGANSAILFLHAVVLLDHTGGDDYTSVDTGDDLVFTYSTLGGTPVAEIESTGFLNASSDELRIVYAHSSTTTVNSSFEPVSNAALVLMLPGAIETGNSPIDMKIYYKIIDTDL